MPRVSGAHHCHHPALCVFLPMSIQAGWRQRFLERRCSVPKVIALHLHAPVSPALPTCLGPSLLELSSPSCLPTSIQGHTALFLLLSCCCCCSRPMSLQAVAIGLGLTGQLFPCISPSLQWEKLTYSADDPCSQRTKWDLLSPAQIRAQGKGLREGAPQFSIPGHPPGVGPGKNQP